MNICVFGSQIAPSSDGTYVGGSVSTAVNISRSLSKLEEYEIYVLTTAPRDWDVYKESIETEWAKISVRQKAPHHPRLFDGTSFFIRSTISLVNYCRNNDIDLIHSHSGYPIFATIPIAASIILRIPVVHSLYCPIPDEQTELRDQLSGPKFSKLTLSQADHILAMSENVRNSLLEAGLDDDVTVIPPIIDTKEFHPDLNQPSSVDLNEDFNILFVGNIKNSKGVDQLIRAFEELPEEIKSHLILTFDQRDFPGKNRRRDQINKLIGDSNKIITELGIISDMPNLIANADVVVAPFIDVRGPSDYPLVVLEAMACKTPVIGTTIGGIPELLSNGRGVLVPPQQTNDLTNALVNVYQSDTSEMTSKGYRYIHNNFSARQITQMVEEIYKQVI